MNWLAQPASADALAGVHGKTLASLLDMFLASASAALWRFPASSVPITVGCRNGNALLLRSSDSLGTSPVPSVVSPSRSRTVLRYSRAVNRRSGMTPAAFGSPGAPPTPVGPPPPAVPVGPPAPAAPDISWLPIVPLHPRPTRASHATVASDRPVHRPPAGRAQPG